MTNSTFLIGIAGGSGSGKTTFAKKILSQLNGRQDVELLHLDSYYLDTIPPHLVTNNNKINFDHPDSFDWNMLTQHLVSLKRGEGINSPTYSFELNKRLEHNVSIGPSRIIIFEGIFTLFHPNIRSLLDIKCFLHVDADIRFTRRLHRDVNERSRSLESVISQYYDSVRPMYQKYLEPQKQFADFIVGEETDIAASILAAKIKELLYES